jgi:pimeloyl-ACP methyl ester carboxylesterase
MRVTATLTHQDVAGIGCRARIIEKERYPVAAQKEACAMRRQSFLLPVLVLIVLVILPESIDAQDGTPAATPVATSGDFAGRVDVGGRALFLNCVGEGGPTVLLEAGGMDASVVWLTVQSEVATFIRVCSYDRAGLGQSDPAPPGPRTAQDTVADLRLLLMNAGLIGPYVLVGHSYGGLVTRLYASSYPTQVAGLVLVDGSPPGWSEGLEKLVPPEARGAVRAFFRGQELGMREPIDLVASEAQVEAATPSPPVPAVVLTHGQPPRPGEFPPDWPRGEMEKLWQKLQAAQASAINGRLIVAADSRHFIHQDQPAVVVEAIRQVVEAAQDTSTWATPSAGTTMTRRRDSYVHRQCLPRGRHRLPSENH